MLALINEDIAQEFNKLSGIDIISLSAYERVAEPIRKHADTLLCVIDDNLFVYKDYYEENKSKFDIIKDGKIQIVDHMCGPVYPQDVGLNVLVIGKKLFCNTQYTAKQVLDFAKEKCYEIVSIKQGYAACSTVVIDENTAITSDHGVYLALIKENINTLLVSSNDVILPGYKNGFIGGSVCYLDKKLYVFGNFNKFKEKEKIISFLEDQNIDIISVLPGGVSDFGGVKFIN